MISPRPQARLRLARLARAMISATAALVVGVVADRHGHRVELPAAMTAAAVWNSLYAGRLIRRAWKMHRNDPCSAVCKRTGFFGLGLAATGLTCGVATVLRLQLGADRGLAIVVLAGFAVAAVPFVPALLLLPGAAADPLARLRRVLDAVSVGVCLLFTSWVLIIAPQGRIDSGGFWIAILTCCLLSLMVLTVLRAGPMRRTALACGAAAYLLALLVMPALRVKPA